MNKGFIGKLQGSYKILVIYITNWCIDVPNENNWSRNERDKVVRDGSERRSPVFVGTRVFLRRTVR